MGFYLAVPITSLKSKVKAAEQMLKVNNKDLIDVVLVSLLLNFNQFLMLLCCFRC